MANEKNTLTIEDIMKELPCKNKEIPSEFMDMIEKLLLPDEKIYFYVISDVLLNSKYGASFCAITDKRLISYDSFRQDNEGILIYEIAEIEKAETKRMYGNALFRLKVNGNTIEANKCSYSVIVIFDAISQYINDINEGKDKNAQLEIVYDTYIKRMLYCKKCGRRLPYRNAPCIKCADKKQILGRLFGYVKPHLFILIIALAMAVVSTIINLIPPLLTKQLVDHTLIDVKDIELAEINNRLSELFNIVLFLFTINTVQNIIGSIRGYILRVASERIVNNLKTELYTKSQYLPIKYYDKTSTGSVISRINGDTGNLNGFIIRISQEVLTQFIQLIGIIIVMVSMNPILSLLSLIPIPLVVIGSRIFSQFIHPYYYRIWKRGAKINSILADTLPGIKVVKAFTSEEAL
ncbi:MAG: transporter [Clostridia bacterium]|nr:transporter [Clostridia bacterium]